MEKYGLKNKKTGELATYYTNSNGDGDCCCELEHILGCGNEHEWLVDTPENAEYARLYATKWFNAGYETPNHSKYWKPEEWEVVKLIITTETVPVQIPTMKEYLKHRYEKTNPPHYEYCLKSIEEHKDSIYTLYDLKSFLEEKK